MMFYDDQFVGECRQAITEADPVAAVVDVVGKAVSDGAAIDAALGRELKPEPDTLFSSPELTVQRILWPGGAASPQHDHRMWAVVGVYAGEEVNRVYRRFGPTLEEQYVRGVARGEVLCLDEDAIHSVENLRREWTAGLHVYGGDIVGVARSAWGPDGVEVSYADNAAGYRAMFKAMRDLAAETKRPISDDDRYEALTALRAACTADRRYLTPDEARQVIAGVWAITP